MPEKVFLFKALTCWNFTAGEEKYSKFGLEFFVPKMIKSMFNKLSFHNE